MAALPRSLISRTGLGLTAGPARGSVSDGEVRKYGGERSRAGLVAFATGGWQDAPPAFSPLFSPLGLLCAPNDTICVHAFMRAMRPRFVF